MNTALRLRLTVLAGLVIIVLTGAAFWLSYAHLHDVAATHGLGVSPERAWAWPATLDLFIVSGEILMLVAALANRRDYWSIGLTVAGSVGSIALNVCGVGAGAQAIDYVVAAVPPSAALLAFGALMAQVHRAITKDEPAKVAEVTDSDIAAVFVPAPVVPSAPALTVVPDPEPEPAEEIVETVSVVTAKPSKAEIAAAIKDIEADGHEATGPRLAAYFGVSDRTGRRYLSGYLAA